jgi:uncharacterized OB-fold protein
MEQNSPINPIGSGHEPRADATRLTASRRRVSGALVFPPVPDTSPAAPGYETVGLSASATLYSFTTIHPNPKTGKPPFTLVYADFPEGVRIFGRLGLPDGASPKIGMALEVVVDAPVDGSPRYFFIPASGVVQ